MEITDLQRRIRELENENKYLKSLLDHAGISYVSLPSALPDDDIFTSIAVFRNKAYIHRSGTNLSSQKEKRSEKHIEWHQEGHPVS